MLNILLVIFSNPSEAFPILLTVRIPFLYIISVYSVTVCKGGWDTCVPIKPTAPVLKAEHPASCLSLLVVWCSLLLFVGLCYGVLCCLFYVSLGGGLRFFLFFLILF